MVWSSKVISISKANQTIKANNQKLTGCQENLINEMLSKLKRSRRSLEQVRERLEQDVIRLQDRKVIDAKNIKRVAYFKK